MSAGIDIDAMRKLVCWGPDQAAEGQLFTEDDIRRWLQEPDVRSIHDRLGNPWTSEFFRPGPHAKSAANALGKLLLFGDEAMRLLASAKCEICGGLLSEEPSRSQCGDQSHVDAAFKIAELKGYKS